jgi:alkylated DNA nucleotide flippase Atl1
VDAVDQIVGKENRVEMSPKTKKSWSEKLADSKDLPKVIRLKGKPREKWGAGTMVIPAPLEVDQMMRKVPKGKVTTINEIRVALAEKHGATVCCPLTTGIFAWIAANAAEEKRSQGKKSLTPYWRTLKSGGLLNEKYPGGIENQKKLLEAERHLVVAKGKRYRVDQYERALQT